MTAEVSSAMSRSLLFLHGWGVTPQSYRAGLDLVANAGFDVLAPAQPGFGGTPALRGKQCSFQGYASWAAAYLRQAEVELPVAVVGHSFGGGVAIQLAHDHPDLVHSLVVCNSVGGPVRWSASGTSVPMARRPLWDWGLELGTDLMDLSAIPRVLPAVLEGALPNLLRSPLALVRVAGVVMRAHLLDEARRVAQSGKPITVVWSDRDGLVPHSAFAALCHAASTKGLVVEGPHSWLIANPTRFADVVLTSLADAGIFDSLGSARDHEGSSRPAKQL